MKIKKYGILIAIIVFAVALFYFVPRVIVIVSAKQDYKEYENIQKIELEDMYYGRTVEISKNGITFELPIYLGETQELSVYESDSSYINIRGNEYDVTIWRKQGQPIIDSVKISDQTVYMYLNAQTFNEYHIKLLERQWENPSIFQSISNLRVNYINYYDKNMYFGIYGNKYTTSEKDNYSLAIIINEESSQKTYDKFIMFVYDNSEDYEFIAQIEVAKDGMSLKDISFIVNSLIIEEY